jgi:hypothetical protein
VYNRVKQSLIHVYHDLHNRSKNKFDFNYKNLSRKLTPILSNVYFPSSSQGARDSNIIAN